MEKRQETFRHADHDFVIVQTMLEGSIERRNILADMMRRHDGDQHI